MKAYTVITFSNEKFVVLARSFAEAVAKADKHEQRKVDNDLDGYNIKSVVEIDATVLR